MPNWTTTALTVRGPADKLEAIRNRLGSPDAEPHGDKSILDFNLLMPMPAILSRVISPIRYGPEGRPMLMPLERDPEDPHGLKGQVEANEQEADEIMSHSPFTT